MVNTYLASRLEAQPLAVRVLKYRLSMEGICTSDSGTCTKQITSAPLVQVFSKAYICIATAFRAWPEVRTTPQTATAQQPEGL